MNFEAIIKATLDTVNAQNQLNAFIQQAQNSPINIPVNMTQQGRTAGQQFANAFTSSLNKIDLRNGGVGNIQRMLQGVGLDKSSIALATKEFDKMSLSIGRIQTKQLKNGNIRMNISGVDDLQRSVTLVEDFNNKTGKISTASKTFTQNFKEMGTSVGKAQTKVKQFNQTQAETFGNQMTAWARNNSKAVVEYGDRLQDLHTRLQTAISSQDADGVKQIRDEFRLLQSEARATGNVGKTFGEQFTSAFGSMAKFAASYVSIRQIFNTIREGIRTVNELDDALVDLQKTTTATPQQLSKFYGEANDIAKQYGTTTKQIIQGAAD